MFSDATNSTKIDQEIPLVLLQFFLMPKNLRSMRSFVLKLLMRWFSTFHALPIVKVHSCCPVSATIIYESK